MSNITNKTLEKLKYDLVRNNLISFEDLTQAENLSQERALSLAQVLIEEKFIDEEALLKFIQDNLRIPYVNLEDYSIDEKCLSSISTEDSQKYRILPLFRIENVLTVAMADPLDLFSLNNLIKCLQCEVEPVICSERLILEAIEKYYIQKTPSEIQHVIKEGLIIDWTEELNEDSPDSSQAEKIINSIVSQALLEESFEITFENIEEGLNIRFRKPDLIENKGVIPLLLAPLCISHIKKMSNLDTGVSNLPQLGKFSYTADIKYITGVVSTFPSTKGERISIKLYNPPKTINEFKISTADKDLINESLKNPGMILIAGPGLSGKSFIAYSLLNSLVAENKNIMTIESIVKYDLNNITQCELNEKVGFNTEKALKFIDFQSPEIIYIEEILSGNFTESLLTLSKSNKLIIAELNANSADDIHKLFGSEELNEIKKVLNCLITVKNTNNIVVTEKLLNI